jgi:hypothetical protein
MLVDFWDYIFQIWLTVWPGVRVKISTDETISFQTLVQFSLPLILVEEVRKETSSFALFGIIEI